LPQSPVYRVVKLSAPIAQQFDKARHLFAVSGLQPFLRNIVLNRN
jgi:hypothetical protein